MMSTLWARDTALSAICRLSGRPACSGRDNWQSWTNILHKVMPAEGYPARFCGKCSQVSNQSQSPNDIEKEGRKKECDQPSLALATHERGTSNCMQSPHRWRHPKLRTSSSGRTWRSWWWCRNFRNHKFHLWTPLALKAALVPSTGCVLPLAWRGWFGGGGCPVGPRFMRRAWNCVS